MKRLTEEEAREWCAAKGITMDRWRRPIYADTPYPQKLRTLLPYTAPGRLLHLARGIAFPESESSYDSAEAYDQEFPGCLVWVGTHDIWTTTADEVGYHLFERIGNASSPVSIHTHPARLFDPGEIVAAEAAILVAMVAQWDVFIIPYSGNVIVRLSHDGVIDDVAARSPEILAAVKLM